MTASRGVESTVRITDPRSVSTVGSRIMAYIELTKPRIIELLLITTVPAMVVASGGWPGTWLVFATLIGGTLSAGGANAINNVIDRDIDVVMRRTRGRPLPTARVRPGSALVFGVALGTAGFVWLWLTANLLAAALSTAGLLFYVFVYTLLLKRTSTQNIVIGGAAGSVPALVGWAAVTDALALAPLVMFAIVFFWTPPHFWALALRYRKDYTAAGIPMLPVVVGEPMTIAHIGMYGYVLAGVSLLLFASGPASWLYLVVAVGLGGGFVVGARRLRAFPGRAMSFFGYTNVYLAGLFTVMALDVLVPDAGTTWVRTAVLVVASVLVVGGMIAIGLRELATAERRHVVGRVRDAIEVALPVLFATGLVVVVWLAR